jgi:energy-coupling factor transport system ATP-binding protein
MVTLKNISFSYKKEHPLLNAINLTIHPGEHIGIMGPSGCGKSTLLKIINGTIEKERVKGEFSKSTELTFGSIYQNLDNQIIFPNVLDEIVFGMENLCYSKQQMDEKLAEVTQMLDIGHLLEEETVHLSGGEKQLVIMASILCLDVDVLILDECMSQVDEKGKKLILHAIKALKKKGKTVIMVDHDRTRLESVDTLYQIIDGNLKVI